MNDVCLTVPEIAYSDDILIVEFDKNCNIINVKSFNQTHTEYSYMGTHLSPTTLINERFATHLGSNRFHYQSFMAYSEYGALRFTY